MKKIITIFLAFVFFLSLVQSLEIKVQNLPTEYRLLIQDWSKQVDIKELEAYVATHESIFKNMTKEDRFSLIKIEIYRFLIRNRPDLPFEKINSEMISKMTINTDQVSINSFSDWVLAAGLSDMKNILKRKKYNQLSNSERKRLRLAASWPYVLFQFDKEYFKNSINQLLPALAKTIEDLLIIFSKFSHVSYNTDKDLTFFSIKKIEVKEEKELAKKDPAVEVIEDIKSNLKELPKPVKSWVMPGDLAKELSPLKEFKKDKNYIIPNKLPEPVNDWLYNN